MNLNTIASGPSDGDARSAATWMDTIHVHERAERIERVAAALCEADIDLAVLLEPANQTYFSGNPIPGSHVVLVDQAGRLTVFCNEYDAHNFECVGLKEAVTTIRFDLSTVSSAVQWIRQLYPNAVIGLEHFGIRQSTLLAFDGMRTAPVDRIVAGIRLPKSPGEQAVIRRAAACLENAMAAAAVALRQHTSEPDVAITLYRGLIGNGSEPPAGQPYVKSGERAMLTHARWGQRQIAPEDHVTLEVAACVQRYHTPIMRTRLPSRISPAVQKAIDGVRAGIDAQLSMARPGVAAGELHAAYVAALERFGVARWNRHGSGYPVGIAFPPYWGELNLMALDPGETQLLVPGMVLHVISGLTEPDQGVPHVGLSHCVLITEGGHERLVNLPDFLE